MFGLDYHSPLLIQYIDLEMDRVPVVRFPWQEPRVCEKGTNQHDMNVGQRLSESRQEIKAMT